MTNLSRPPGPVHHNASDNSDHLCRRGTRLVADEFCSSDGQKGVAELSILSAAGCC